jgi:hypothetical protein
MEIIKAELRQEAFKVKAELSQVAQGHVVVKFTREDGHRSKREKSGVSTFQGFLEGTLLRAARTELEIQSLRVLEYVTFAQEQQTNKEGMRILSLSKLFSGAMECMRSHHGTH